MPGHIFLVESTPKGLRAASIRDRKLQAIEIDRADRPSLVGSIVQARAVRTLPALGTILVLPDGTELLLDRGRDKSVPQSGDVLTVQVTRNARGDKLGLATRAIALTGRALIHLPLTSTPSPLRGEGRGEGASDRSGLLLGNQAHAQKPPHPDPLPGGARERKNWGLDVKFSRRLIIDEVQRAELLSYFTGAQGGWILRRTAGLADPADLAAEIINLPSRQAPDAFARLAADNSLPPPDRIFGDGLAAKRIAERWCAAFAPSLLPRIESQPGLFDLHDADAMIESLSDARVPLPGGGSLIIEPTEALTVIDVNAGAEANIVTVNLAAAAEIAHQLRLRHIGGIVVIDFISMTRPRDRDRVMAAFESALADDPAQTHILPMSALGLVEMTRERRGPGLNLQVDLKK